MQIDFYMQILVDELDDPDFEYWNVKPRIESLSSLGSRSISYDELEEAQAASALLQEMLPHDDSNGGQAIQHQIIQNHQQLKYMKMTR